MSSRKCTEWQRRLSNRKNTHFLAMVVTRILRCPLECTYCVMNCMLPRPPCGIGALCCKRQQVRSHRSVLWERRDIFSTSPPLPALQRSRSPAVFRCGTACCLATGEIAKGRSLRREAGFELTDEQWTKIALANFHSLSVSGRTWKACCA